MMAIQASTFEIDTPGFRRQVDRIAKKYGTTARVLMLDQMRLWMNDLVRKTPPKTLAAGRRAVANDIRKVFVPIMDPLTMEFFRDSWGEKYPEQFDVTPADMLPMHERWRGPDGRVRQGPRGFVQTGGMKMSAKAHVDAKDYKAYLKIKQSHVGSLKAGWLPGVRKFRGSAPNFVKRQKGKAQGRAFDRMGNNGSGFLLAANYVRWKPKKVDALVAATGRTRRLDISRHLEKRIVDASNAANPGGGK